MKQNITPLVIIIITFFSCSVAKKIQPSVNNISSLKLIGKYEIPYNFQFNNTTVGGLSGIDYDAKHNLYYLVCDDRSNINPARFYTASINFSAQGIDTVQITNVTFLKQKNKLTYPNNKQNKFNVPDPESIRYNAANNLLIWTSEGERIVKTNDTVLNNPSIFIITKNGAFKDSFTLPQNCIVHSIEKGPRTNGVFEGATFADNYKSLFVNVEEPLYEDGEKADVVEKNAFIRFFKFNVNSKKNTAQYAYKLDAIAKQAIPENKFKINGVPEILWVGNNKFLVVERSFSTGVVGCTIKVFLANIANATNIINTSSIKNNNQFIPISKKLLLNMDSLGMYIDNIEGVTLGPTLPNGHKTVLFIADNNFDKEEISQVLLFEIME